MSKKQINTAMSDDELQAFLNKKNKNKITYIIFAVIGVLITIMGTVTTFVPMMFVGILLAIVFIFLTSRISKEMKRYVSDNVVRSVINSVFDGVFYDPFGRLSDAVIENTELGFSSFNEISGSDYISGSYNGIGIEMSDVKLVEVTRVHTKEGVRETRTTVFEGPWMICDFGKELSADLLLVERGGIGKKFAMGGIKTESEEFNKNFRIESDNEHDAFYILTPHMMEYILQMDAKGMGRTHMRFMRGGKVHIAISSGRNSFELSGTNVDLAFLKSKFESELRYITDIIDELRLQDTMYKK